MLTKIVKWVIYAAAFLFLGLLLYMAVTMKYDERTLKSEIKKGSVLALDDPEFPSRFIVDHIDDEGNIRGELIIFLPDGASELSETQAIQRFKDSQDRVDNCNFTFSYMKGLELVNQLWRHCLSVNGFFVFADKITLRSSP